MEKFLDINELSSALRVKVPTIRKWIHEKRIPVVRMGRLVRFRESDVMAWAERMSSTPAPIPARSEKVEASGPMQKSRQSNSLIDDIVESVKREVLG